MQLCRSCGWSKAANRAPISPDEEFGEIPTDVATDKAGKLFAQVLEERVAFGTVDSNLGKHGETDTIVDEASLLYFLRSTGFLAAKLVAGEAEYFQPLVAVFLIKRLQTLVLGSESALAGSVDNEDDFAGIAGKIDELSLETFGLELMEGLHGVGWVTLRSLKH